MDPLTHAASGAMLAMACRRPRSALAVPLAALVSASPDLDIFFSSTPVGYLLYHRGITHSLMAVPVLGLLAALFMGVYWKDQRRGSGLGLGLGVGLGLGQNRDSWSFGQTYILAMLLLLLHIWLDCVTTYGTMIFLPFSDYRVRLNGIFIVDFLLLLPLLAYMWQARKNRGLAALLVLWTMLYPATCVGLRMYHEAQTAQRLQEEGIQARHLTVLPDALAPFFWRILYETDTPYVPNGPAGPSPSRSSSTSSLSSLSADSQQEFVAAATTRSVHQQGLDWRGRPITEVRHYPVAETALTSSLATASGEADVFFRFTVMPLQEQYNALLNEPPSVGTPKDTEYRFYDLRFGTMLPWVEKIMQQRSHGEIPFLLLAKRHDEEWTAVRMEFSGANRSAPWEAPQPPQKPTWWEWLIGGR